MVSGKRIVIFGANGKVGRLLVEYALAEGHAVTAFVHKHHDLPDHKNLKVVRGDIYNSEDVDNVIKDQDVVMSALASWGTPKKDVLSVAINAIIPAMKKHGARRIVSVTGAEARADGDHIGVIHRFAHMALGIVAGKVLSDGERHIDLLQESDLEWVVIRSPVMLSGDTQNYLLSSHRPLPWALIDRLAVARAMINQLTDDTQLHRAVFIHFGK